MKTCPLCNEEVSELIEDRRFDQPLCYYCAQSYLGLPNDAVGDPSLVDTDELH